MAEIIEFRGKQPETPFTESSQQVFLAGEIYEIRSIAADGAGWTQVIDARGRRILVLPATLPADLIEHVVTAYRVGHARGLGEGRAWSRH